MKIKLTDLPKRKDLIGKMINIVRQGGKYHYDYQNVPKKRKFLEAIIKIENGVKWIYWYWKPEADNSRDYDCGFSGVTISPNFDNSYLEI